MTSFFRIKAYIFCAFLKNDKIDLRQKDLGKNTCSLQPVLKNNALSFKLDPMSNQKY